MWMRSAALPAGAMAALLVLSPAAGRAADTCALLHTQTQRFSDAGQRDDTAALASLLDDRAVFVNENGDIATKADLVSGGMAPPPGMTITMTVMDWACELHGNTAVARFTDDQVVKAHGDVSHAQYRSVETWLDEGAGGHRNWRMIGSATIALQVDPPVVALPAATLDEYVGSYVSASGARFTFSRMGADLMASLNGSPPTSQKAELRDVVFTPGHARVRKIFQRDAGGKVVAFAYRHEGHDTVYRKTPG